MILSILQTVAYEVTDVSRHQEILEIGRFFLRAGWAAISAVYIMRKSATLFQTRLSWDESRQYKDALPWGAHVHLHVVHFYVSVDKSAVYWCWYTVYGIPCCAPVRYRTDQPPESLPRANPASTRWSLARRRQRKYLSIRVDFAGCLSEWNQTQSTSWPHKYMRIHPIQNTQGGSLYIIHTSDLKRGPLWAILAEIRNPSQQKINIRQHSRWFIHVGPYISYM